MTERDAVLQKAREPRSEESIEAEARYKLERGKKIAVLEQLIKTPEWKIFKDLVEEEELLKWESKVMDPQAIETGVTQAMAVVTGPDGSPQTQKVPAPIEGMSLAMQVYWRIGVAWGIRNTLTYAERAIKGYVRMMEAQNKQRQLLNQAGARAPISGINKNPADGGS